jgi:hypothetical protein
MIIHSQIYSLKWILSGDFLCNSIIVKVSTYLTNECEQTNERTKIRLNASLVLCALHTAFVTLVPLCSVLFVMHAAE